MIERSRARELFALAQTVIAGGVSSDARRMDGVPMFVRRGEGSRLWDVDGNEYVDYVLGQGAMVLGHSHPAVVDAVRRQVGIGQSFAAQHELEYLVAKEICTRVPCAELVRFNSVGTEAVQAAWRVARGFTRRPKILKFEGHYHGWLDANLWSVHPPVDRAGTASRPDAVAGSAGQVESGKADVIIAPWNDWSAFAALYQENRDQIAAVVLEPLLCNTGCIAPVPGFLESVAAMTQGGGSLLIFDEVITGFRLARGGAQEYFGVVPDLAVFGKAIAAGFPLSCLAGRREVMDTVTLGQVLHAGTFNANPIVMAAAHAALGELSASVYERLLFLGGQLIEGLRGLAAELGVALTVEGPGPMFQTYFGTGPILNYRDYAETDLASARRFHRELFERGINIVPRGLWFLSAAHDEDTIAHTLAQARAALLATTGDRGKELVHA